MADRANSTAIFIFAAWFALLYFCAGGATAGCAYLGQLAYEANVQRQWEVVQANGTVPAVVAARELKPGTVITVNDLYLVEISPRWLSEGVFLDHTEVVSQTVRETILSSEFVRAERLEP